MDYALFTVIEDYIKERAQSIFSYHLLTDIAPNRRAQALLTQIAERAQGQLALLQEIYYSMLKQKYALTAPVPMQIVSYREGVSQRLLEEIKIAEKYGKQSIKTMDTALQKTFARLYLDAQTVAAQLAFLLAESGAYEQAEEKRRLPQS